MKNKDIVIINEIGMVDMPKSQTHYISLDTKQFIRKPFYATWETMINAHYTGDDDEGRLHACKVDPEWCLLSFFKEWYDMHHIYGYIMDKDLMFHGNKLYSPRTCIFVPFDLHDAIFNDTTPETIHGKGITFSLSTGKFAVALQVNTGNTLEVGEYSCLEHAQSAYRTARRQHIQHTVRMNEAILPSGLTLKIRMRCANNEKFERFYE